MPFVSPNIMYAVVSKPDKTVLGFLLVRLSVGRDGVLKPVWHRGYTPHSVEESVSKTDPVRKRNTTC